MQVKVAFRLNRSRRKQIGLTNDITVRYLRNLVIFNALDDNYRDLSICSGAEVHEPGRPMRFSGSGAEWVGAAELNQLAPAN
jgi:hypothetical protein